MKFAQRKPSYFRGGAVGLRDLRMLLHLVLTNAEIIKQSTRREKGPPGCVALDFQRYGEP